jgi:hypothetical protein
MAQALFHGCRFLIPPMLPLQAKSHQSSSGREARLLLPLALHLMQSLAPAAAATAAGQAAGSSEMEGGGEGGWRSGADAAAEGARRAFSAGWRGVPLRALLPWVPQMLSRLGDAEGQDLAAPLEELARRWACVCVCECVCVCVCACVCACMHACARVGACVWVRACGRACTWL